MRRRAGLLLMLVGLLLASLSALLVLGMAQQSQQQTVQQVKQVYVVTVAKDIPENTIVAPEMLAVKAFPAEFAPANSVATVEEATGKYASTRLFKDSVLLRSQLSGTKKARDVAANLPPGKVAFWMPMPPLISGAGGVKPGDRLDLLLTVNLAVGSSEIGRYLTTQTTLQNVEVFAVGTVDQALSSSAESATKDGDKPRPSGGPALVMLVDHQDAIILKFIKDVDGVIDMVLRSADDAQIVRTDGMTPDALIDRFKFRVPSQAINTPNQGPGAPSAPRP